MDRVILLIFILHLFIIYGYSCILFHLITAFEQKHAKNPQKFVNQGFPLKQKKQKIFQKHTNLTDSSYKKRTFLSFSSMASGDM